MFTNDLANGDDCTERLVNGSTFKGTFKDGKKNEFGILNFYDGNVYEGEFKNNHLDGKGKLILSDKTTSYTGMFKNNRMHGLGVYDWGDGVRIYIGTYIKDKK